ncbi:hypothetical protein [Actinoplanes sp. NPDC051494]|uniref:hypothetical protein n=1 Tax=Actinoplanes sp. NPDC051494 TaxID=3363907 RepID=UPI00378EB91F
MSSSSSNQTPAGAGTTPNGSDRPSAGTGFPPGGSGFPSAGTGLPSYTVPSSGAPADATMPFSATGLAAEGDRTMPLSAVSPPPAPPKPAQKPARPAFPISGPPNRNSVPSPEQTAAAWSQLTGAQSAVRKSTQTSSKNADQSDRTTVLPPSPAGDRTMAIPSSAAGSDATMPFSAGAVQGGGSSYGVNASGGSRQPFGQPSAPGGVPSGGPTTYGSGSGQAGGVPQQRGDGTVYGGLGDYAPADMTMPMSVNPADVSGSLTGHILAQGWRDNPDSQRKSNVKVIVAMLLVLVALLGVSLAFLFTVGDAFSDMIGGVFS